MVVAGTRRANRRTRRHRRVGGWPSWGGKSSRLAAVSLDEHSNEVLGDRCEECGAKLTAREMQAVLESGGPVLCSIHAAEDEPGLAADEADFSEQ